MLDSKVAIDGRDLRHSTALFLAAALPALVLYLVTLAPSVTAEDSGELVTAAYTLGIAHPPGYPLWCLLGKAMTYFPLGLIAWRVNLLSAVLGALSAGLVALLARRLFATVPASLAAAWIFAASRDFWSQAVVAEVYTLNVAVILFLLLLALEYDRLREDRWLYFLAFAAGVGATNHSTVLPLAPLFAAWIAWRTPAILRRPVFLGNLLGLALVGFSLYLYVPLRSAADPVMDWGDPESLGGAWNHFLRRQYEGQSEAPPRTFGNQAALVVEFARTFSQQFSWPLAVLSLAGAWVSFRRERATFLLLAALFVLTSYGFIFLIHYAPTRENLHLVRVFFLPAYAVAAIWLAQALGALEGWGSSRWARLATNAGRRRGGVIALAGALLLAALPALSHFQSNDHSQDRLALDWGRNLLSSLEPNAVILPLADHSTFPLIYLQTAEGLRTDVICGNRYGYIEDKLFGKLFEDRDPPRVPPPLGGTRSDKERYVVEHSGRAVYFTGQTSSLDSQAWKLVPWGLAFRAVLRADPEAPREAHETLWRSMEFSPADLERAVTDYGQDLILSDYHAARGRFQLVRGEPDEALASFRRAAFHGRGVASILNNLGGTLAESQRPRDSLPFLKSALELEPGYDLALKNIANVYLALEDYKDGFPWIQAAWWLDERNQRYLLGKARGHRARGEKERARNSYELAFLRDAKDAALRQEIEGFLEVEFADGELAKFRAVFPPAEPAAGTARAGVGGSESPLLERHQYGEGSLC